METRPLSRNLALSRLGVGMGVRFGGHLLMNAFRGARARDTADREFYREQARRLATSLGRLKGSAMKAGQLLALFGQAYLPAEALAELAQLHELSEPVPWSSLEPALARWIGRQRLAELDIDETPIGAASLAQVHRARRRADGVELCLKIQYPGVSDAIDSDVQSLGQLLLMTRLAPSDLDLAPTLAELKRLLKNEADYVRERLYTEDYARCLARDPRFIVPRVFPEYSGPHVLGLSYEPGASVLSPEVQALPLARRNALAGALIDLFLREFFDWHLVQTDPNYGNFRFRLDGPGSDRIVLLDFGATRQYSAGFVQGYRDIVAGALAHDRDRIVRGSCALSMLRPDLSDDIYEGYARACEIIVEPFADHARDGTPARLLNAQGAYRWAASDLLTRAAAATARNAMTVHFRLPPPELVFLHRRLIGTFSMLAALGAELSPREQLLAALGNPPLRGKKPRPHSR